MTWIKLSWCWLMYRSGYSYKDARQNRILALKLKHEDFLKILRKAKLSHGLNITDSEPSGDIWKLCGSMGPRTEPENRKIWLLQHSDWYWWQSDQDLDRWIDCGDHRCDCKGKIAEGGSWWKRRHCRVARQRLNSLGASLRIARRREKYPCNGRFLKACCYSCEPTGNGIANKRLCWWVNICRDHRGGSWTICRHRDCHLHEV
jgi:hypothetical protein